MAAKRRHPGIQGDGWQTPMVGALAAIYQFYLPRPNSHFRTGKNAKRIKDNAPLYHVVKPDATKLIRAAEDALTGVVWRNNAQVVVQLAGKCYCCPEFGYPSPGVLIKVLPYDIYIGLSTGTHNE